MKPARMAAAIVLLALAARAGGPLACLLAVEGRVR